MNFRYAKREDTALILDFIKGLAEYEKMTDEVVADEKTLAEWIFDKQKAEVIFALENEKRGRLLHCFFTIFRPSSVVRGYILRICLLSPNTGEKATVRAC